MPRGTALSTIVTMLKAEVGDFSGTNAARDSELKQLLFNKQSQLLLEVKWPFMVRRWDAAVPAGGRFVTFPTVDADYGETCTINFDQVDSVEVQWNNQRYPVLNGIGSNEYNIQDPLLGQASDPIQRWRQASNTVEPSPATSSQFEVWPLTVSPQVIRFTAERLPQAFTNNTDKADLDDMLLVLGVAADILTRTKQPDAKLKGELFARRLQQLRSGNPTVDRVRILGGSDERADGRRRDIKLVAIH